ncbi:3,4-dihydroxy-2-butanone-4-phosphate synthase [Celeribacter indicus]|uniref:3,4-dihydroxy-2-butanone 4-phosphate synthase n=1 Tax=Celeribacter indicus TaxID=1208324 RepID=A0A0B5E141_9RHOB|nr:3,4-dihydroxy-2-butanone-4-phosphate synthase [Celeribacter indicus]AJE46721.1 XRE family transcriptional regulator [Celeribacter indicus]SDX04803.1 3,4-dihydroxy 2-butanone 4-phosphate synthase / GTP cyclohydrolase II [Celeribacter indicus]
MNKEISEAISDLRNGRLVVVVDDEDRENEGDLICAAALCTPEQMAFIVRHTCGIVCTPLSAGIAARLGLAPMVAENDSAHGTAFTVSVDLRAGHSTGISAADRANTVRALADPGSEPQHFARPGHVFPLLARPNGVLERPGHTEAAVDLCRLAGLPPVGVICELVNDDGTVKKGQQIDDFARQHGLRKISVQQLVDFRRAGLDSAATSPQKIAS